MNTCVTERARTAIVAGSVLALLLAPLGRASAQGEAEEGAVGFRGEATLGTHFYAISPPFDDDAITGFFDQYRYIRDKDASPPTFVDLFHLDLGFARDDDTYVLRLERESHNAINHRALFDADWRGIEIEADYGRYRSDSLRFFPMGTGAEIGGVPVNALGVSYDPDVPFDQLFDQDRRIFVKRGGGGGEIALSPAGFGLDDSVITKLRARGRTEGRTGFRQDSFLQDGRENTTVSTRFRGNRREIDQQVTSGGGGVVFAPWRLFTGSLDFDFEGFREDAPVVDVDTLATPGSGITPPPSGLAGPREFYFVPDTNRLTGVLSLGRRFGEAQVHAGAFVSHLEQTGRRSNLQQIYDLDDNQVTTVTAQADFSAPVWRFVDVDGFFKYLYRKNDVDEQSFDLLVPPGQESPYMRRRDEFHGSFEVGAAPAAGMHFAIGYRGDYVDRDWLYPDESVPGIQPPVSLVRAESLSHTLFLKGRARLFRGLLLSGELAGVWAPKVAYARDLSEAIAFQGRGSYTATGIVSFPVTLSVSGRVLDGENDEFWIVGSRPGVGRDKGFARTEWGYDLTLAVAPIETLSLFTSFSQAVDHQQLDHVRSDFPRYQDGPSLPDFLRVQFFVDSMPDFESDVKSLTAGGSSRLFDRVDASLAGTFSWVDAVAGGSATGDLIDGANRIDGRIITLESDLGYALTEHLGISIGYRYQQYLDDAQLDPLSLNETVHTATLRVRLDFAALR